MIATHLSGKPFSGIALAEKVFKKFTRTSTVKKNSYFSAAYGKGIESQIINDKGNCRDYRIVVVGDIIYQIMIISTKGFAYKSERINFFDSFKPI